VRLGGDAKHPDILDGVTSGYPQLAVKPWPRRAISEGVIKSTASMFSGGAASWVLTKERILSEDVGDSMHLN
jgi:hypothetical protein